MNGIAQALYPAQLLILGKHIEIYSRAIYSYVYGKRRETACLSKPTFSARCFQFPGTTD